MIMRFIQGKEAHSSYNTHPFIYTYMKGERERGREGWRRERHPRCFMHAIAMTKEVKKNPSDVMAVTVLKAYCMYSFIHPYSIFIPYTIYRQRHKHTHTYKYI